MKQHAEQGVAIPLPARQYTDTLEYILGRKQEAAQQAAKFGFGGSGRDLAEVVENARVRVQFFVLILREVVCLDVMSRTIFSSGEWLRPCQQFDKSRFTRPVDAHQCNTVAALDHEADIAKNALFAVGLRHIFEFHHDSAAGLRLRKREVDRLFFFRKLDPLHPFQFLDPALHLLCLGGGIPKTIDKYFQLLDSLALIAITSLKLLQPLCFLI